MASDILSQLNTEYYKLLDVVAGFDQRLMTIKGWGATVSLVALGAGFQNGHYGLFLVAALGGLAFWIAEAWFKQHQMRYYLRMRHIEVACYELSSAQLSDGTRISSPLIDWSWVNAPAALASGSDTPAQPLPYAPGTLGRSYRLTPLLPQVFLPHLVVFAAGIILFLLGLFHKLGAMPV